MFPHGSLILAILRLPFSALRCQRELSKDQYALEAAAEDAFCFELLWYPGSKKGSQIIARIKDQWGISFYVFFIYMVTLFLLETGNFFLDSYVFFWICMFFSDLYAFS